MTQTTVTSLKDQLDTASAHMQTRLPSEAREIIGRTVAYIAAFAPGLVVGDRAPDFTLPDQLGRPVSLAARREQAPVVVSFYRGEWCPWCNVMLRAINARLDEIEALGATLVAISPQASDHSLSLTEKHELGFEVLSDERQEVIAAYRLSYDTPGEQRKLVLDRLGLDVAAENADGTCKLPATATFVIDRDGIIVAAGVTAHPGQRMEPDAILSALCAIA